MNIQRSYLDCAESLVSIEELVMQEERNRKYVDAFCRKAKATLVKIDHTNEDGIDELMYYFNDNRGGYTLAGIIGELITLR